MSTAGSAPLNDGAASQAPKPTPAKRGGLIRWRGAIPLALFIALLVGGWLLFGARVVRSSIVTLGSAALGTQLDLASVRIGIVSPSLELRGLAVANNDELSKNHIEVGTMVLGLEALPLFQKKLIVNRVAVHDVRVGTTRATPAKRYVVDSSSGAAAKAVAEVKDFAGRVKVPVMSLVPLDSLKALVMDPQSLKAVQAAVALERQVDSVKRAVDSSYNALNLKPTIDSSAALAARLQGANARTLGIEGGRRALADVRRTLAQVDSAKSRVDRLATGTRRALDTLDAQARAIDAARQEDYATARSLLRLPSFDAPEIGSALFGGATLERFQKTLYWVTLARQYAPPGLMARESDGPRRVRMAGKTVHFVTPQSLPRFLVRRADISIGGGGAITDSYAAAVSDLSSDPAITGKPTIFVARRVTRGADSARISGSLDHTRAVPRDVLTATVSGTQLPSFAVPMLPYTIEPGKGTSELRLVLDGDKLQGSWALHSGTLAWKRDSARARPLNTMETLVAQALTGISDLDLRAEIGGTLKAPTIAVRSNLDRVVSERLRSVAGQQIAAAQARAKAQVDKLVDEKAAPVKARVTELRTDAEKRASEARARLDEEKRKLEERLRALTAGIRLP